MKKKILFYALVIGFLSVCSVVFGSSNTYASCNDAGGHLGLTSSIIGLDEVGGDDYGIGWACGRYNTNSAIMFIADSVSISNGNHHIYADIELSTDEWTAAELYGMVHYHGGGTSTQYASHIGFCRTRGSCAGTGKTGKASINTNAEGADAGGLIWFDFDELQRAGSGNPHPKGNEYWALPYYHKTIWINNAELKKAIKEGSVEMSDSLANGGTSGWVKIYIHKCFSSGSGGAIGGTSTCEEGSSYISVTNVIVENPTTFDHSVSAALGSCTGTCWIDADSGTVTFTHSMKRNNDGPDSAISNSWWAYDKAKSSVNGSTASYDSGTVSFAKNSGWKTVKTHNVSVSLSPGGSTTKCETNWIYKKVSDNGTIDTNTASKKDACITVKRYEDYTFTGWVTPSVSGLTKAADGKYYVDADTVSVKFDNYIKRTDSTAANVKTNWEAHYGRGSTANASGSVTLAKSPAQSNVHTHGWTTYNLTAGDNLICDRLYYYSAVHHNGNMGTQSYADGCVTIHRYAWYTVDGRVKVETDATEKSGTYFTDANSASIQFIHQLKRNTTVGIQTWYYTSKSPNPGDSFNRQSTWAWSTINKNNDWYTQYKSPSSAKGTVSVAKDDGSSYCQTLHWYGKVREDSADRNTEKSANGCIALKRYKTTFTGNSKIYVNSSNVKDASGNAISSTTNIAGKKIYVYGSTYPVGLPMTFKHTVTRSSSDANGSPNKKSPVLKTTVTKHDDVRAGDDYGSAINTTVGPLAAGESGSKSDTFTLKVYPEHSIKLCQKMTYTSEIQGEDHAYSDASEVCVEIVMAQAECFGEKFGIKNGKNYLQGQIYKNTSAAATKDSGVKTSGSTTLTAWAKPGDQIRFNYDGCAGGELARQYADTSGTDSTKTKYTVTTDTAGYLFGNTLSSSPYNATSKTVGESNAAVGTGPFSSGSFTFSVTSPHGSGIYSCSHYGTNNISDFYRIPAYIHGVSPTNYRDNCKSDDYGRVSDLGETIKQTATWSNIQYTNGSRTTNANASITAEVKVPYNYLTEVETSGNGGYILPGTDHTERLLLTVVKRPNEPVNGSEEYATATKPSKYRLIEIIVGTDRSESSSTFNDLVNNNEYFPDSNGSRNLGTDLDVCKSFNCTIVKSGEGQYSPDNNGINGQSIADYTREIPYNIDPGVKYCYLAAVWPSDSHLPTIDNITEADNINYGMVKSGVNGFSWHVSGATCFTVAKRPSFAVLNGDTYAQRYISARVSKYPTDGDRNKMRIYGSWTEYGAIAGMSIKGYATGATLWGGSNNVADAPDKKLNCIYSSLTFSNKNCANTGSLGSLSIDTTASSDPKNLNDQLRTRYTRSNADTERPVVLSGTDTALSNAGNCVWNGSKYARVPTDGRFDCISDTGVKYIHAENTGSATVSIKSQFCLNKGDSDNNHTTVIHSNGTLVVGADILYGTGSSCAPETYTSIAEVPQFILAAKKIVIKQDVTHIDAWLIADEIITCDPGSDWAGTVAISEINTKNCNKQLTINGSVITKNLKMYRTYGSSFEGGNITLASPAEIFKMGPESYFWAFGQAERYSQATTTYARELAPRY